MMEIVYDRETHDYAMYLDGELVGFARTYHDAEVTLDQLRLEQAQHAAPLLDPALDIGECPNAVLQAIQGALDGVDVPGWMGPHDDIGRARHALNTVYAGRACQLARQGIAIERACQLAWNELWHAPNMPEIIRHTLQGGTS